MFVLVLNDMRSSNIEMVEPVFRASSGEILQQLLERESVEPYQDGRWRKSFRSGGPLEWYNPPTGIFGDGIRNVGTEDDWARQAVEEFQQKILSIQEAF